jgi:hypothetical protein
MVSEDSSPITPSRSRGPLRTIVTAWLLAGTLDITVASIYFPLAGKFRLILLYQGIASGVLGARAFAGGMQSAILGLLLHYLIALIWTVFFFFVYPKMKFLSVNRTATAVGYAVFVSCVMTFVVLPLSNVHHYPVKAEPFLISTVILMFTIGLPITTVVRKYYSTN